MQRAAMPRTSRQGPAWGRSTAACDRPSGSRRSQGRDCRRGKWRAVAQPTLTSSPPMPKWGWSKPEWNGQSGNGVGNKPTIMSSSPMPSMDASDGFVSTSFSLPTCAARHVSTHDPLGAWAAAAPLQAWYSLVTLTLVPLDAPCGSLSRSSEVSAGRTRRWERRCHICAGPRLTPTHVCTVTGSPLPHLHRD
jgi:hypothetical protein